MQYDTNTRLVTPPGSSADIYSAIINQFHGNGLQQGASLGIAAGMMADSPGRTLAFFNGDLSYGECSQPCMPNLRVISSMSCMTAERQCSLWFVFGRSAALSSAAGLRSCRRMHI